MNSMPKDMVESAHSFRHNKNQERERRAGNRERELLEAAIDVFYRQGFSAASIREIAGEVGMSKATVYHYVSTKEELLFRIFDDSHQNAVTIMNSVAELDLPPLDGLREYLLRFITYYAENIKRVGLYYRERRFIGGEWGRILRDQRREYDRFVRQLIEDAKLRGELPASLEPQAATYFVMAAINGISDWYRPDGDLTPDQLADRYVKLALSAIGANDQTR